MRDGLSPLFLFGDNNNITFICLTVGNKRERPIENRYGRLSDKSAVVY